jgi:hypothetical protein
VRTFAWLPLSFACVVFAALAGPACAAPFAVRLGDTRIVLDVPAGYADTTFTGSPRLQELAEALTSASNRILVFAISDDDLRRFTQGDRPEFRRYMLVATPKASEHDHVTPRAFQRIADDALRGLNAPAQAGDIARQLEAQPVGMTAPIAQLRRDAAAITLLQGTRLEPTKTPRLLGSDVRENFILSTSTLILVRGKVLNVQAFTLFDAAEDEAWLRALTARWVDELQRLNGP